MLAWRAGLRFRHVPVTVGDLFSDEPVDAMADALRELDGPIVAYCKTGLRSAVARTDGKSLPVQGWCKATAGHTSRGPQAPASRR